MKKTTLLFLLATLLVAEASATEYKILYASANSIYVGDKDYRQCTIDGVFQDYETIHWDKKIKSQCLKVMNMDNRKKYILYNYAMAQKSASNIKEYMERLTNTKGMSSRGATPWSLLEAKNVGSFTERRVALVIGNSTYLHMEPLNNPQNDADLVASNLQELGFDVLLVFDASKDVIEQVGNRFRQLTTEKEYYLALLYYAGHGLQEDRGVPYICPIDAKDERHNDILETCWPAQELLDVIQDANCYNNITIFDACRTNKGYRASAPAAMSMTPPKGFFLCFSTSWGEEALDMVNKSASNGPFASSFVDVLKKPNKNVTELFEEVRSKVLSITNNEQMPNNSNLLYMSPLYINGKNIYPEGMKVSNKVIDDLDRAKKGDVNAQFRMGQNYQYGLNGYEKDDLNAYYWYAQAAKKNHVEAMNKMGAAYFVQRDYTNARKWFEKAAKAKSVNAQFNLGYLLFDEQYGQVDRSKAMEMLKMAADSNNVDAQFLLGYIYFTQEYYEQAKNLLQKAADQDDAVACYYLAKCYLRLSNNSAPDKLEAQERAFEMYLKSAELGCVNAQYAVCRCYWNSIGVPKDEEKARTWCEKAAMQGYAPAQKLLKETINQ